MKLLCAVIVFLGVFALNNAQAAVTLKKASTDQMLVKQLLDARASNPSNAAPCFELYLPIYDAILQEFSTSYQLCITDADEQNAELDEEAKGNQTLISAAAQGVCDSMTECSALDESLEFLDCYSQVGDANIRSLYILTNNATDVAANLREAYRVVENNLEKCQNASERAYVESTADTTDALNNCLLNGPPAVVTTTTTEEPETTTAEPESTTESTEATESTSVEPEEAFEEEDLSRAVPVAPAVPSPPVVTSSRLSRFSKRQRT